MFERDGFAMTQAPTGVTPFLFELFALFGEVLR
jgi:hypothetical protein